MGTAVDLCPVRSPQYGIVLLGPGFLDRSWLEVVLGSVEAGPHTSSLAPPHHVAEAPRRRKGHGWQDGLRYSDHLDNQELPLLAAYRVLSHSMAVGAVAVLVLPRPGPVWYQDWTLLRVVATAALIAAAECFEDPEHASLAVSREKNIAGYPPQRCSTVIA